MTFSLEVVPPVKIFFDKGENPEPLEGGYIYVGVAGLDPETNRAGLYWDIARTIPATQPVRTIGGRPDRNGAPGILYSEQDYSITVRNQSMQLVYTSLNNYTDELNKFYYFNSLTELKAATTTGLIGERIIVAVGNGDGNPDDGLDFKGGLFKKVPIIVTPSIEYVDSNGEFYVSDVNGVQFKNISKLQAGSHIGRNILIERDSFYGKSMGLITKDAAGTNLEGWYMAPKASLNQTNSLYAYNRFYFDPVHKSGIDDYRLIQHGATTLDVAGTFQSYFIIRSYGEGSYEDQPLPIRIQCGNVSKLDIDRFRAANRILGCNEVGKSEFTKYSYGLQFDLVDPPIPIEDPYTRISVANFNLPVGEGNEEYGISFFYDTELINEDLLEITGSNQVSRYGDTQNKGIRQHVASSKTPAAVMANLSFDILDVSKSDFYLYSDVGLARAINKFINGRLGQIVTIACTETAGSVNVGNAQNIKMPAPVSVSGSGSSSISRQFICIDEGVDGNDNVWRQVQ